MPDSLGSQALKMGVALSDEMCSQFASYESLLLEWNEKMNLTAITDSVDIQNKHFLDSLSCVLPIKAFGKSVIDIGTGAGFPGIPIKIARPDLNVTLLDSLNKRITFLDEVIKTLNLKEIRTYHGRAEEFARKKEHRSAYDYAYARAVARLNVLSEYCLPFVKTDGYFISQKGSDYQQELIESENALKKLGGKVEEVLPITIPDTDFQRVLIVIRKTTGTPEAYPRIYAKIEKAPL